MVREHTVTIPDCKFCGGTGTNGAGFPDPVLPCEHCWEPESPEIKGRAPFKPTRTETVHCNRSACREPVEPDRPAWWNIYMNAWYCQRCAFKINDANDKPILFREDRLEGIKT